MVWFVIFWAFSLMASCLIERFTQPASPYLGKTGSIILFRLTLASLVFGLFFILSWRPGFSAFATAVFYMVWTVITRAKSWYVHEPVVFSDLVILIDIFRFPNLFYASFLNYKVMILTATALIAFIAVWFWMEAAILPETGQWAAILLSILVWAIVAFIPFAPGLGGYLGGWAFSTIPNPDYERDIARYGFLTCFTLYALCWREEHRQGLIRKPTTPQKMARNAESADLVIVVQSESFYDLRHLGYTDIDLPGLDAARQRAIAHGRLQSHVLGGYTLRSEFSMLTGLSSDEIGFDRFYPYLNAAQYGQHGLAQQLKGAGFSTHFLHPFYAHFFSRDKALPHLGFDNLLMLEAFAGAPICGNYISDDAVADRIIRISKSADKTPQFIFTATMENHGPWESGRLDGLEDQVDIYMQHLRNADAMLVKLVSFLENRDGYSVLLFYGDHVPILKTIGNPFPDDLTDYVLMEFGKTAKLQSNEYAREIHQLPIEVLKAARLIF